MFIPNSSMVKVWEPPVLVTVSLTVSPLATVIVEGLKIANFAVTVISKDAAASGAGLGGGVGAGLGDGDGDGDGAGDGYGDGYGYGDG